MLSLSHFTARAALALRGVRAPRFVGSVCTADRQQGVVRVVRHVLADVAVAQLRERVQQAVLLRVYMADQQSVGTRR